MRKQAVLLTLVALEVLGLGLLALFWLAMRPELILVYRLDALGADAFPWPTRVALSSSFVPSLAVVGMALAFAALLPAWRPRTRLWVLGAALVVTVFGLTFAVFAAYAPAFEELLPTSSARLPANVF
ncbi:MAG TPA: hypothetical protein VJT73_17845, partial [Polyangiaceae bacterium]|nr:hypothetical protein [Polyangiaceae bacterium]